MMWVPVLSALSIIENKWNLPQKDLDKVVEEVDKVVGCTFRSKFKAWIAFAASFPIGSVCFFEMPPTPPSGWKFILLHLGVLLWFPY